MGNLLSRYESFIWQDVDENRSTDLQNFNYALTSARAISDSLFRPQNIFDGDVPSSIFYVMYIEGKMLYEDLKLHYSWLTADDYQVLMMLGNIIGGPTDQHSNTWDEFSKEYNGKHISLIGLQDNTCIEPLVFCKVTHAKFHSDYIALFSFEEQKGNLEYFKEYFVPKLKIEPNIIKNKIATGQLSSIIERLDVPPVDASGNTLHGQQIHIHLALGGKKCALNIDGTWKHPLPKDSKSKIPSEICTTLSSFGFKIPDEYYH